MTRLNMSIIVAGYAIFYNIKELAGIFTLRCVQSKEYFRFLSESTNVRKMRIFCFDKRNYIIRNRSMFVDLGEQKLYQVVNVGMGIFDVLDINEKEMASVRKEGDIYKVIDYKQMNIFDFELVMTDKSELSEII